MTADADERRVRGAALRVGALVAIFSALIIASGVGILVAVLVGSARPDHDGDAHPHGDGDAFVVDLDHVLPWVIGLGIAGMLLLGAVGWLAARWSVRPLADALRTQRAFVADASHELRTPLTALTSRIQILERRRARGEPIDETVQELRRDAVVMKDVLTDMLLAAEGTHVAESADVPACVTAAAEVIQPLAAEGGVAVTVDAHPAAAAIPPVTLTRLCVALLDNAVQHTPAGGRVSASVRVVGSAVEIRVADSGTGVTEADADRIFDRFARGAESGRTRGFGLGLALVRDTAHRFGGSVALERTSPQGTVFLLKVPVAVSA